MSDNVNADLTIIAVSIRQLRDDLNVSHLADGDIERRARDRAITETAYALAEGIHVNYPWLNYEAFVHATSLIGDPEYREGIDWKTDRNWIAVREDFRAFHERRAARLKAETT